MAIYLKKRRTVIEEWKRVDSTEIEIRDTVDLPFEPFEQLGQLYTEARQKAALPPVTEVEEALTDD